MPTHLWQKSKSQQSSFTDLEQSQARKLTRRQKFLNRLDQAVPWTELEARIRPFYHQGTQGRQPYPLAIMLRVVRVSGHPQPE